MAIPESISHFDIREEVGRGGFAVVYRAFDRERGEEIALKVYESVEADPEALAFERRGVALQQVLSRRARQVAEIYGWGDGDGRFWVAMEYVRGTDLSAILKKEGRLPEERAVAIAVQLCEVLDTAHNLRTATGVGIVHGDVKPENIRVLRDGQIRVFDFGIAKSLTGSDTRNVFGTPMYRPPESLRSGKVDRRTDLWAVGIVLYQMISGEKPYRGSPEELEEQVRSGLPPQPLPTGIGSPALRQVLAKSLAATADRRHGTACELQEALQETLTAQAVSAPTVLAAATRLTGQPAPPSLATAPQRSAAAAPAVPGAQWRPGLRSGVLVLAALLALSEARAVWEGRALRRGLAEENPDLAALRERYRSADRWSLFDLGLGSARAALQAGLLQSAEGTFDAYHRGDLPADRWREALGLLQQASTLGADDRIGARLIYAQAQLDRVDIPRRIPEIRERKASYAEVARRFEEAARLDPQWPDPYLGLVALYASPLRDLARLRAAWSALESRGLVPGAREKAMLAAACQRAGDDRRAAAGAARGTRRELMLLLEARGLLQDAVRLYGDLPRSARVNEKRQRAKDDLARIAKRLESRGGS